MYEQTSVSELRQILIDNGVSEEEAASIKGKANLVFKVMEVLGQLNDSDTVETATDELYEEDIFDNIVVKPPLEKEAEEAKNAEKAHDISESDWHDYVMSNFNASELFPHPKNALEKLPNVAGLRRVAKKLLGNIIFSGPTAVQVGLIDNIPCATVTYLVEIESFPVGEWCQVGQRESRRFAAVADCWHGNVERTYATYPAAIAETRAEARALKKALGLNMVTYEEVSSRDGNQVLEAQGLVETTDGDITMEEPASETQRTVIQFKCKQLGLDLFKFINKKHFVDKTNNPEPQFSGLDKINKGVAIAMIKELNAYQNSTEKAKHIPKEIMNESNN